MIAPTAAVALGGAVVFTLYSLIPVTRAHDPQLPSLFVGTMMAFVMAVQVFTPALERRFSLRLVLTASLTLAAVGALVTGTAQSTVALLMGGVPSAAALVGLGVGTVQTLPLHMSMRRMDPGRASAVWNLGVDGGLRSGGHRLPTAVMSSRPDDWCGPVRGARCDLRRSTGSGPCWAGSGPSSGWSSAARAR